MTEIGEVKARITADTSKFVSGMSGAQKALIGFSAAFAGVLEAWRDDPVGAIPRPVYATGELAAAVPHAADEIAWIVMDLDAPDALGVALSGSLAGLGEHGAFRYCESA